MSHFGHRQIDNARTHHHPLLDVSAWWVAIWRSACRQSSGSFGYDTRISRRRPDVVVRRRVDELSDAGRVPDLAVGQLVHRCSNLGHRWPSRHQNRETVPCVWHRQDVGRGQCRPCRRRGSVTLVVEGAVAPLAPRSRVGSACRAAVSTACVSSSVRRGSKPRVPTVEQLGRTCPVGCRSLGAETREQIHYPLLELEGAGGERLRVKLDGTVEHLPSHWFGSGRPAFGGVWCRATLGIRRTAPGSKNNRFRKVDFSLFLYHGKRKINKSPRATFSFAIV